MYHALPKGTSLQNLVLFFDVCHRVCETQLSTMVASAVVFLHFMALIYTHPCAVYVAARIFLEVSQV